MDFFREFNLTRGVIVVSLLASAYLGYLVKGRYDAWLQLNDQLETQAPRIATEIQRGSQRLQQLIEAESREGFKSQDNPELYFQSLAKQGGAELGDVQIQSNTRPVSGDNRLEDQQYTIQPLNNKDNIPRQNIANYLLYIEERSRRVKVTNIELKQVDRRDEHEYSDDRGWTFTIQATSRVLVDES